MNNKIIPAILEYSEDEAKKKIELALSFTDTLHIDIIDSSFSEKTTLLSPEFLSQFTDKAFFELHMMVQNPEEVIDEYSNTGLKRFIGHIEHMSDEKSFITKAQQIGEVFLGIDYDTDINQYCNSSYNAIKGFTVMTIHAGKSGQVFIPDSLEKVQKLRTTFPDTIIEVDGGINNSTYLEAKAAGANQFAMNSYIFGSRNPRETYYNLTKTL